MTNIECLRLAKVDSRVRRLISNPGPYETYMEELGDLTYELYTSTFEKHSYTEANNRMLT